MESDNPERSGKHFCKAFLKGIPDEIVEGGNEHLTSMPVQNNHVVYERASGYAEMEVFKSKRGF